MHRKVGIYGCPNHELTDEEFEEMNTNLEAQLLLSAPVPKSIEQIFSFTIGLESGEEDGD
ncbi:MAG: hypothetical protein IKG34_11050 [Solobacterium sp.]|nr:hypothetical protein [Solobacterium sp.]